MSLSPDEETNYLAFLADTALHLVCIIVVNFTHLHSLVCFNIGMCTQFQEEELDRSHAKTPIMSGGGGNRPGKTPHKLSHCSNALVETPKQLYSSNKGNTITNQQTRQRQLYTPAHFTLAKNAELNMDHHRSDAFSPATIRMTDSLEKILTDDDDFLDARHRLVQQQTNAESVQEENGATTNQTMAAHHQENAIIFDSYSKEQEFDVSTPNNGSFRRIQSTEYDSADDEMKDLGLSNIEEANGMSQKAVVEAEADDEDEEEAEISQINDNEELNCDIEVEAEPKVSFSRPKPLKFNQSLGPTSSGPISAVSASSGGAFKPAKRVSVATTSTPRPQRNLPRNSTHGYHNDGAHYQHHSRDLYFPSQHPQHGYFGHHQGEGRVDGGIEHRHSQHPASNMMFNDHQSRLHLQYSHDQSHLQIGPLQQHHHSSPNYHLSPLPSPQNLGYGNIPTIGVVSPLTLPPDYGHGNYDYHTHATHANLGRGSHPHHVMNTIHGGGLGENIWWRGGQPGHSDGFSCTMPPHLHHEPLQQQGGVMPVPGHSSPDYSYHEMMSMTPPYNLPHHHNMFSRAPPPMNITYPRHHNQHNKSLSYHQAGASRPRTKSKENNGPRINSYYRNSQSPSPTIQQGCPDGRGLRPRKDSAVSANSGFSGEDDLGDVNYAETISSPNLSSTLALRQHIPCSITSASTDNRIEQNDWFHQANRNNNGSYSEKGSRCDGSYFQPQQVEIPQRVRKGSYDLLGTGDSKTRRRVTSVEELKIQQQHELNSPSIQPPKSSYPHPCPEYPPHKYGEDERKHKDGADNVEGKHLRGEFVLESPSERQAFKDFGKQFRQKKNESLTAARDYALACLSESNRDVFLPSTLHWRVHLELADVAKRSNQINTARSHYRQACTLQPHASQGWLEHSKLEEESGNLRKCASILQEGLSYCTANENLLIMAIKFYERMGELDQARHLLSRLKHFSIDKSWKTMLEGALLEARAGRYTMVSCTSFLFIFFSIFPYFTHCSSTH